MDFTASPKLIAAINVTTIFLELFIYILLIHSKLIYEVNSRLVEVISEGKNTSFIKT